MIKNKFDMHPKEGSTTHVVSIFAEIPKPGDRPQLQSGDKMEVAILPMRNMVLFPDMTTSVAIGRAKSMRLVQESKRKRRTIGVVCQYDSNVENPSLADLYRSGTLADIVKVLELPDGSTNVILQGRSKFMLDEITATDPFLKGVVTLVEDEMPAAGDKEYKILIESIEELARKVTDLLGQQGNDLQFAMMNIDNPQYLMHFLATNLPFDAADKQKMLEERNVRKRAYLLYTLLSHEAQLLELKADIQSRTREDLSQQQREHFLQQQIKTIQEELGSDDEDLNELEAKHKKVRWDKSVEAIYQKELKKLERLNNQAPDYSVQYGYLDTMLSLPWNKCTRDSFNIKRVEKKLDSDHYGLEKVKDRILEHLSVLKLRKDLKAPIICLYGPPGVGKTSLGRSVAEALNRNYHRISLGGLHDEAEIRGHRRTYIGALPGRIIEALRKCESSNPVIVLDEIDKVGQDYKGDPSSALLEVLDPEQNSKFHDNYLDVDYDLSKVLFIATANTLSTISQPLLDRMEVIEITGYVTEEKVEIAKRHLLPKQLDACGFDAGEVTIDDGALVRIIEGYTRESGVRELEKKISQVLRKLARLKASRKEFPTVVTEDMLTDYLGAKDFARERYEGNDLAGVVTGLAWTAAGGEILFVESSLSRGKGEKLTLTGNLGDVMKESAVIALQYLRSHARQLGIDDELFDRYNVHIHVPEGAIPKDGPSAGVTMVTSLASSFTQRRVRAHLAMTGEITLRGKVMPVGGVKEKILAAKRAGITDVVLCRANEKDISEIEPIYIKGLTFHYVDTIKDVLSIALLPELVPDAAEL